MNEFMETTTPGLEPLEQGFLLDTYHAAGEALSKLKLSDVAVLGCLAVGIPKALNSDNGPLERLKGGLITGVGIFIGNTN